MAHLKNSISYRWLDNEKKCTYNHLIRNKLHHGMLVIQVRTVNNILKLQSPISQHHIEGIFKHSSKRLLALTTEPFSHTHHTHHIIITLFPRYGRYWFFFVSTRKVSKFLLLKDDSAYTRIKYKLACKYKTMTKKKSSCLKKDFRLFWHPKPWVNSLVCDSKIHKISTYFGITSIPYLITLYFTICLLVSA